MMNQETYDYILEILSREPSFNEGIRQLKKRWPTVCESVSEKTLKSIQAQYYVRRMRRNHYHHYSRDTREKYYRLYKDAKSRNEKNVIMRLAAKNDISPCLLARIILEEYYWNDVDHGRERERNDGRGSLPPGFMTDCIRDIARLPNPELAREIYETIVLDNFYGPAVDSIKKSCGVEYEMILKAHCREAGLSFIDENQMRDEGYDKTPDILLKVPIMVNSRVVNWIESKASFGDPINHQQYMIDQYLPYKNRFGPGAVIYWFGFVKELAETGERGILLLGKFPGPGQITHLRDVHEQEQKSLSFHFLCPNYESTETVIYNNSYLDSVQQDNKFYNYVDPMFDSDEEEASHVPTETFEIHIPLLPSKNTSELSNSPSKDKTELSNLHSKGKTELHNLASKNQTVYTGPEKVACSVLNHAFVGLSLESVDNCDNKEIKIDSDKLNLKPDLKLTTESVKLCGEDVAFSDKNTEPLKLLGEDVASSDKSISVKASSIVGFDFAKWPNVWLTRTCGSSFDSNLCKSRCNRENSVVLLKENSDVLFKRLQSDSYVQLCDLNARSLDYISAHNDVPISVSCNTITCPVDNVSKQTSDQPEISFIPGLTSVLEESTLPLSDSQSFKKSLSNSLEKKKKKKKRKKHK